MSGVFTLRDPGREQTQGGEPFLPQHLLLELHPPGHVVEREDPRPVLPLLLAGARDGEVRDDAVPRVVHERVAIDPRLLAPGGRRDLPLDPAGHVEREDLVDAPAERLLPRHPVDPLEGAVPGQDLPLAVHQEQPDGARLEDPLLPRLQALHLRRLLAHLANQAGRLDRRRGVRGERREQRSVLGRERLVVPPFPLRRREQSAQPVLHLHPEEVAGPRQRRKRALLQEDLALPLQALVRRGIEHQADRREAPRRASRIGRRRSDQHPASATSSVPRPAVEPLDDRGQVGLRASSRPKSRRRAIASYRLR